MTTTDRIRSHYMYWVTLCGEICSHCGSYIEHAGYQGTHLPVGQDDYACSKACALALLGEWEPGQGDATDAAYGDATVPAGRVAWPGEEPTKPEPPVPTRELARDAWKRLGAERPAIPERWPATEALLALLQRHPLGTAPAAEWHEVYALLHPEAMKAEADDMLRMVRS